ncbi:tRNA (adenosine(37)-N6)-dimethylallyltransferase MiaA [Candidatus Dojkabacteria bacterium]|uniref:tRNA dimethylallyltransferase n=1 Tax=Candidatus Dojkabacteria bacterium TaxID=2099670 RepID=A0A955L4M8_9BACT|nr:tRNA (adenosine(37)-N6)-dimethylallyltransferase MiaA [Candidatus Dojkabacteria bacterium]
MAKFTEKIKLLVVAGPTASGKTSVAIDIAKRFGGELINADSRQIYKYMDIGTNKGVIEPIDDQLRIEYQGYDIENSGVVAWGFDLVKPGQGYTLSDYKRFADKLITDINSDGKVPILVGGTGLYIDAVINNYTINTPPDLTTRSKYSEMPVEQLKTIAKKANPETYNKLNNSDVNNPRRLIRIIEGRKAPKREDSKFEVFFIYPKYDKDELYATINQRVDRLIDLGLQTEVQWLMENGYAETEQINGLGYKQMVEYMNGDISYTEMIEKLKQSHRNYAKRQAVWFEGDGRNYKLNYYVFNAEIDKICSDISNFLNGR